MDEEMKTSDDENKAMKKEEKTDAETHPESSHKESRRLLSTSANIPTWLQAKYEMRPDVGIQHVQHASNILPHFQIKLPQGEQHLARFPSGIVSIMFPLSLFVTCLNSNSYSSDAAQILPCALEVRQSCAASYSPDVPAEQIDERLDTCAKIPAKKRSMLQAWFICWRFQDESHKKKRRRVA